MLNYRQTVKDNIEKWNKPNPLADFLIPFIGDKKEVRIADIGSGPYSVIGSFLGGVKVWIQHSDTQNFSNFWWKHNIAPSIEVEYQDMEHLTYVNDSFDIVTCINALDHTADALAAVKEMIRVCKPGGYVYIDCCLDQLDTGHKHYWNVKEDGIVENRKTRFDLKELGFSIKYIDNGGERRYNHINATLKK